MTDESLVNNLGKRAEDKITGFKGTITGFANFLYRSPQYQILIEYGTDQPLYESPVWFDVARITVLKNTNAEL